jgi:hypothetical protein
MGKRLIILDWDDTLFPTSWVLKNKLDLNDEEVQNKYIVFFSRLDNLLYKLFMNFTKYGDIFIVTNAMVKWVAISCSILPNTKRFINDKIGIISARDAFQDKYPNKMDLWKKLIFKELTFDYFKSKNHPHHTIHHVISVGDAPYEFEALVDLHDHVDGKKILKSIRFLQSPTYESLIDQLEVLHNCIHKVCKAEKHMDLKFEDL